MTIELPERALVVLVGASSSGKSTFARHHFQATEILSSDAYRAIVADDENDQSATGDAFEVLHLILEKRLKRGRLTVIDATNAKVADRRLFLDLARRYGAAPVAVVFDMPEDVVKQRHRNRPDRHFPEHVIDRQLAHLLASTGDLKREGFHHVYTLRSPDDVANATVQRSAIQSGDDALAGPFDIIGDVHGCLDELRELLTKLGYDVDGTAPVGRKAVFVGDLVDRGPDSAGVLRLVMGMVRAGSALCVPGNHDDKLMRKLQGRNVQLKHGLAETLDQLNAQPPAFRAEVRAFLEALPSHYVLDGGRLVVAHAGLREELHGQPSGAVRGLCLFGPTTGQTDEHGLPVRINWAADYRGRAAVVYGHTPVAEAVWQNNTIDIDTGCVFGGKLTALRYPERELVSVPARRMYAVPARPFLPIHTSAPSPAAP